MTARNWHEAANAYRKEAEKPRLKEAEPPKPVKMGPVGPTPSEIDAAVHDLEAFLRSEDGAAARTLLATSGRHINFGETREGGGYETVYYIDGTGLHSSYEAFGTWTAYARTNEVPSPRISAITAREAIEAATAIHDMVNARKKPAEVVSWLREELNKIAAKAPRDAAA